MSPALEQLASDLDHLSHLARYTDDELVNLFHAILCKPGADFSPEDQEEMEVINQAFRLREILKSRLAKVQAV